MIKTVKTTIETTIETNLTGENIVALIKSNKDYADCFEKGGKFTVIVKIPSGGDYSGLDLIIGEDVDVIVTQIATAQKKSEE